MKQEKDRDTNRLRWIALTISVAGALWLIYYINAYSEEPFTFFVIFNILPFIIPLLAGVSIGWKWPLIGGVLLIVIGLSWGLVMAFSFHGEPLKEVTYLFLKISLPFILPGGVFFFSWLIRKIV